MWKENNRWKFHLDHEYVTGSMRENIHSDSNKNCRISKHMPIVIHYLYPLFHRELVPKNYIFDSLESFILFYKTITVYETQ